jgi:serine protease AprX
MMATLLTLVLAAAAAPAAESDADDEGVAWLGERNVVTAKVDQELIGATGTASVIVQAAKGMVAAAEAAVTAAQGTVVTGLPLVNGFEASVPAAALPAIAADASVRSVSANRQASFEEYSYDESTTASSFARTSGASALWGKGYLGQGIGVAVIDTGVSPMPDLAGRVVHGPDLSGEGTSIDNYGHGTVMAGIIGGSGADSAGRIGGAYTGVAPRSTLVAVKAAGRNGVVDVSTMLQAMHWVAAYKDQFNIRVLNLSWGTSSTQSPALDPLNYAVQRLWKSGIVVVVAAGNSGPQAGTITKPGDDPVVLTVGAFDDKQNVEPADDAIASWSSRGPTVQGVRKPDLIAPGRTLIASRSYGSYVETTYPKALISPSYIKGSGTSEAAAVVSGLAALVLQANPTLTPDQVKGVLMNTASPIAGISAETQGAGRVLGGAALAAATATSVPAYSQSTPGTGLGSLEASRGGANVQTDCNGDGVAEIIKGEIDVRCEAWVPSVWAASPWDGTAWTGDLWPATDWAAASWTGRAWTGGTWSGRAWTGRAWTGSSWADTLWAGRAWTGAEWTGSSW